MNEPSHIRSLLQLVDVCLGYRPGVAPVEDWRRAFDNLTSAARSIEKRVVRTDRDRLAVMLAGLTVLVANANEGVGHVGLMAVALQLRATLSDPRLFRDDDNLRRRGDA
ncbi:MAG: hypothetical protein H6Q99_298 [Proteobacteria bacterium]|nr:hypothetical protein [Pseudomonadota bacterium]